MNGKEIAKRAAAVGLVAVSMGFLPGCNNEGTTNLKPIRLEDISPAVRPAPMPEPKGLILNEITFKDPP